MLFLFRLWGELCEVECVCFIDEYTDDKEVDRLILYFHDHKSANENHIQDCHLCLGLWL